MLRLKPQNSMRRPTESLIRTSLCQSSSSLSATVAAYPEPLRLTSRPLATTVCAMERPTFEAMLEAATGVERKGDEYPVEDGYSLSV